MSLLSRFHVLCPVHPYMLSSLCHRVTDRLYTTTSIHNQLLTNNNKHNKLIQTDKQVSIDHPDFVSNASIDEYMSREYITYEHVRAMTVPHNKQLMHTTRSWKIIEVVGPIIAILVPTILHIYMQYYYKPAEPSTIDEIVSVQGMKLIAQQYTAVDTNYATNRSMHSTNDLSSANDQSQHEMSS